MAEKSIKPKKQTDETLVEVEQPVHILLRVHSDSGRTISAHSKIIAEKGKALLGKMGRNMSDVFINALNDQIKDGIKTYLFLMIREGWNSSYVIYRCPLNKVSNILETADRGFVPKYYIFESPDVKAWFEITAIQSLPKEYIEKIFVISSNRPITTAVNSRTSTFRVGIKES